MKNNKISVDLRIVSIILAVLLVGSIGMWRPWQAASERTITVSGQATTEAEPDEYTFYPTYQKTGTDRAAIQNELKDTVNAVIAKLKELGVEESKITLASSTYDNYWNDGTNEVTSNSLTIVIGNKELAQKVQDYLATTAPQGTTSAMPSFSTKKQKELEDEMRLDAIKDAKEKADRTVDELGAKLGKVKSIEDQTPGGIVPMMYGGMAEAKDIAISSTASSMPVLPGVQEVSYTVTVTYTIR